MGGSDTREQSKSSGKYCPNCCRSYPMSEGLDNCPRDGAVLAIYIPDALLGSAVAERYDVFELIGTGGWSKVFKATQRGLNRFVALKVMHAHLVNSPDNMARFKREAEAASRLTHPSIAGVFDYGVLPDGRPYMVMEYLEGQTLESIMDIEGAISWERAVALFVQCCEALFYAHSNGVLHRDLKPSNILVVTKANGEEQVKLLDFGLAKIFSEEGFATAKSLTTTGATIGTPIYMSPEQCRGQELDQRSDIYSLGCLMYEVLTNNRAIVGETVYEVMHAHVETPPIAFNEYKVRVPQSLECVVRKALAKDPSSRYADMNELKQALLLGAKEDKFESVKQVACPIARKIAPKATDQQVLAVWGLILGVVLTGATTTYFALKNQNATPQAAQVSVPPPAVTSGSPSAAPLAVATATTTTSTAPGESPYKNFPAEVASQMNEADPVEKRIAICEKWVQSHPKEFNYYLYNELRHMYGPVNDTKKGYWTNELLKMRVFDDYQMNILGAWQIGKDNKQALRSLLFIAEKWKAFKYVRAACLLKVGDIYASEGEKAKALKYYSQVLAMSDPELKDYRSLAKVQQDLL